MADGEMAMATLYLSLILPWSILKLLNKLKMEKHVFFSPAATQASHVLKVGVFCVPKLAPQSEPVAFCACNSSRPY
jgi:hypothetical protein